MPATACEGRSRFLKLGARKYLVISIAMVAARLVAEEGTGVTFADVAGCEEAKRELLVSDGMRSSTFERYRHYFEDANTDDPLARMLYVDTRFYLPSDMLIKVECHRYVVYLNGVQMLDFTYPSPGAKEGVIALQLHSGGQGRMRFKDLWIRDLSK